MLPIKVWFFSKLINVNRLLRVEEIVNIINEVTRINEMLIAVLPLVNLFQIPVDVSRHLKFKSIFNTIKSSQSFVLFLSVPESRGKNTLAILFLIL